MFVTPYPATTPLQAPAEFRAARRLQAHQGTVAGAGQKDAAGVDLRVILEEGNRMDHVVDLADGDLDLTLAVVLAAVTRREHGESLLNVATAELLRAAAHTAHASVVEHEQRAVWRRRSGR